MEATHVSVVVTLEHIYETVLACVVVVGGFVAKLEKVSVEEAAKLSKNFGHFAANEVHPDKAREAIAQLQEQEAKIKRSTEESKVREAPSQVGKTHSPAASCCCATCPKQAEERRLALEASLRVLEKQQVEEELHKELDQQAELDRQQSLANEAAKDKEIQLEFDANREAFRREQALKRTTAKSAWFWAGVFALGAMATRTAAAFAV
ncbi:hypothetical protein BASA81_000305 [Batrachochytrium salamandrivorans]|nr:hypothetical protein BASA81_000305 [Batrachochytrium salamandrivorans]